MKFVRYNPISATANTTLTSAAIDLNQILKISVVAVASSASINGSLQLQVSNDPVLGPFQDTTFTNWSNLGNSLTLNSTGSHLIAQQDVCYRALRAVFTDASGGTSTATLTVEIMGISV